MDGVSKIRRVTSAEEIADTSEQYRSREELEKALNEMKKSETQFRTFIDAVPVLLWRNLPDGSNEFLNQRWHDYTGLSEEEAHGWGWRVTFHPEDLEQLMDKWQSLLTSGAPGEIEARLRRFDGEYRWFLIRAVPHRDEEGKIVH